MKRFIKLVALLLALVTVMAVPATAASMEGRASSFFGRSNVYLYKVSSIKFEAWFSVTAVEEMDQLGASSIKIQRSSDGENWTTMRTYTKEDYSNLIRTDASTHAACVTYAGTPGYYYQAIITLYAKNGSSTGEVTRVTATMQL